MKEYFSNYISGSVQNYYLHKIESAAKFEKTQYH